MGFNRIALSGISQVDRCNVLTERRDCQAQRLNLETGILE